jgi:hypothetical protein
LADVGGARRIGCGNGRLGITTHAVPCCGEGCRLEGTGEIAGPHCGISRHAGVVAILVRRRRIYDLGNNVCNIWGKDNIHVDSDIHKSIEKSGSAVHQSKRSEEVSSHFLSLERA